MKKCFDNIKSLDMSKMRDRWEGSHMNSSEGEKVEFTSSVHLEGAVEVSCAQVYVHVYIHIVDDLFCLGPYIL